MRPLKYTLKIGSLTALTILSYMAGQRAFVWVFAQAAFSVRPYVLEQEGFKVSNGKEVVLTRTTESRRRDGAVHSSATHLDSHTPGEPTTFRRVDLPDGTTSMIVDAVRAKSSARLPPEISAARNADMLNPPAQCAGPGEKVDGQDNLFGQTAFRIILQQSEDSLSRSVEWRLSNFSCRTVQGWLQTRHDLVSAWETTLGNRLVAFAETDPDPTPFTNSDTYEEMKPSDIKRALNRQAGITPEQCKKCFADEPSDVNYLQWRASKQ